MRGKIKPTRFAIWVWGRSIGDFETYCLRALMQPGNLPWLARNGYPIVLDFYTIDASAETMRGLERSMVAALLAAGGASAEVRSTFMSVESTLDVVDVKRRFFQLMVERGVETSHATIVVFADMFFGDGSIRNLVSYGSEGVTLGGLSLRVKRERFDRLLQEHASVTSAAPVSNARVVDMAFDALIDSMRGSIVDNDANASFQTSVSLRMIGPDLYAYTLHIPSPMLYAFKEQDRTFFERCGWNFYFVDHIWPSRLIAQGRWQVMTSSDLFFAAELNAADLETGFHTHELQAGMLYNDDYVHAHLNGRYHQHVLMSLRRERLSENTGAL